VELTAILMKRLQRFLLYDFVIYMWNKFVTHLLFLTHSYFIVFSPIFFSKLVEVVRLIILHFV
jgi:hypothetical protein